MNLSDLVNRTRFWLNEQGTTSGFYSDTDLKTLINDGNQRLNRAIINIQPQFFTISATFPTVANTKRYTLPTDFQKMVRLEHVNTSDASDIEKISEIRFPRVEVQGIWPVTQTGKPLRYFINSTHIEFVPIPDTVYTIRIFYDNAKATLVADSDVPASPSDFHDMIALHAVQFALLKNSENPKEFVEMYEIRQQDLMESLMGRDGDDPETVEAYLEELS